MSRELSASYHALGLVALDEGRNQEGRRLFEQARDWAEKSGDSRGTAQAEGGLGLADGYLGDLKQARAGHRRARELARAIGDPRLEGHGLANEAMVDIWEGQALPAVARLDTARRLYQVAGSTAGEQNALGQLATAHESMGREDLALAALDSSLTISRRLGLAEQETDLLRLIAGVHLRLGDYREALATYQRAETGMRAGGLWSNLGAVLRGAANASLRLGDLPTARVKLAEALTRHTESAEPLERLDDLLLAAEVDARLDGIDRSEERIGEARGLADRLKTRGARVVVVLAEAHIASRAGDARRVLRVLRTAAPDLAGDLGAEWMANALAAKAYARLGNLDSARSTGRRAVAAIDLLRGNLASEALQSTYLADRAEVFGELVVTLLRMGRPGEAFEVADAARSRRLLDHIGATRTAAASGAPTTEVISGERLLERIDELVHRLRATERSWSRERGGALDRSGVELASELAQARREYEGLMVRAAQQNTRSTAILGARRVQLYQAQRALREEEALVEYLIAGNELVTFILTRDSLRVIQRPIAPGTLVQQVRLLRDLWERHRPDWELGLTASRNLYQTLIASVLAEPELRRVRRLMVVPQGVLNQVPFAALQDGVSRRFLSQDLSLVLLPAAAALTALREQGIAPSVWSAGGSGFAPFTGRDELPATGLEVEAFRAAAPGRVVRLRGQATETALRIALAQTGIVHVATHGVLNVHSPLFSRIELAVPSRVTRNDDGRLEIHEVLGLTARSSLVFLSGCETGARQEWLDDPLRGTGDLSLAQALLSAGAENVITTLWRIEDAGAARFATHFYQNLTRMPLAEAFVTAQRAMAADPRFQNPYYWAGYVLSGEGGAEPLPQTAAVPSVLELTARRSASESSKRSRP